MRECEVCVCVICVYVTCFSRVSVSDHLVGEVGAVAP